MEGRSNRARGSIGLVAALVLAVGALGIGIASGQTTGDTYTGCLRQKGLLVKVAIGSEPKSPCHGSAVEISWNEIGPQGPQGSQGPQGLQGQQGPAGSQGLQGSPGISAYFIATTSQTHPANVGGLGSTFSVICPGGRRALGGGASALADDDGDGNFNDFVSAYVVTQEFPIGNGTGWTASFSIDNSIADPFQLTVYAICANVT